MVRRSLTTRRWSSLSVKVRGYLLGAGISSGNAGIGMLGTSAWNLIIPKMFSPIKLYSRSCEGKARVDFALLERAVVRSKQDSTIMTGQGDESLVVAAKENPF